ncbi:20600_t:CDS:2 [Gigaspora margarita]|uniref:20600_t:CDS:1 n=1 Tax=Gigaspora margarita TaxID=4874 RepID=A0ABM8VVY4_GIGMA|nr:20600_t:CDS:2 [Gigaspora margarita]
MAAIEEIKDREKMAIGKYGKEIRVGEKVRRQRMEGRRAEGEIGGEFKDVERREEKIGGCRRKLGKTSGGVGEGDTMRLDEDSPIFKFWKDVQNIEIGKKIISLTEGGNVFEETLVQFKNELKDPNVWYLVNGKHPMRYEAKTILATLLQKENYQNF